MPSKTRSDFIFIVKNELKNKSKKMPFFKFLKYQMKRSKIDLLGQDSPWHPLSTASNRVSIGRTTQKLQPICSAATRGRRRSLGGLGLQEVYKNQFFQFFKYQTQRSKIGLLAHDGPVRALSKGQYRDSMVLTPAGTTSTTPPFSHRFQIFFFHCKVKRKKRPKNAVKNSLRLHLHRQK